MDGADLRSKITNVDGTSEGDLCRSVTFNILSGAEMCMSQPRALPIARPTEPIIGRRPPDRALKWPKRVTVLGGKFPSAEFRVTSRCVDTTLD